MRLILDTVTFIWAISSPQRLSRTAMAALRKETTVREISVVSLTEIAVKQIRGKLTFGKADAIAGVADRLGRILGQQASCDRGERADFRAIRPRRSFRRTCERNRRDCADECDTRTGKRVMRLTE